MKTLKHVQDDELFRFITNSPVEVFLIIFPARSPRFLQVLLPVPLSPDSDRVGKTGKENDKWIGK